MPCSSEHMEPTRREQETREAAELICYLFNKRGLLAPIWARESATDCYGHHTGTQIDVIGFLCDHLRSIDEPSRDHLIYGNARDPKARRLADWWERHLQDDRRKVYVTIELTLRAGEHIEDFVDSEKNELKADICSIGTSKVVKIERK